jgi:hypothetical protein
LGVQGSLKLIIVLQASAHPAVVPFGTIHFNFLTLGQTCLYNGNFSLQEQALT